MSVREEVVQLARGGMPPHLIERRLWGKCDRADIYYWLSTARRRDPSIPRFSAGRSRGVAAHNVSIPQDIVAPLAAEAQKRGIAVRSLVSALLRTAIKDNLITAILDDGGSA